MEPTTLTAIAVFLSPYLKKAGEKVAEKTVETLFNSHEELAHKFKGLFSNEIITLGLDNSPSIAEINKQLEENPQVKDEINKKIADNQGLLSELVETLKKTSHKDYGGVSINAEKIAQINVNPQDVSLRIENF